LRSRQVRFMVKRRSRLKVLNREQDVATPQ
jgi:hypothetical protein